MGHRHRATGRGAARALDTRGALGLADEQVDGLVVRRFDAPEALETRFYEVRAKSALNRVPAAYNAPDTGDIVADIFLPTHWIDGVRRRIDDTRYSIRFTPRRPGSIWSAVNIAKVEGLRAVFILRDLDVPVVLTGSQIPLCRPRSAT